MPTLASSISSASENIGVISWYISLLSHEPQDLQQNSVYAKRLGELIKHTLNAEPYSVRFLCAINELDFGSSDVQKLSFDEECELVGRGELDPKFRNSHDDVLCYQYGGSIKMELRHLRVSDISVDNMKSLALYVYLLLHSQIGEITKFTNQPFGVDLNFNVLQGYGGFDGLLCDRTMTANISHSLLPKLMELNIPLKELSDQLNQAAEHSSEKESTEPSYEQPRASFFSHSGENYGFWSILKDILYAIISFFKAIADVFLSCFDSADTCKP
jgi:hypothetical protein